MYNSEINSAHIVKGARYMPCSITDEESGKTYELHIKEPKLKVYKKFMALSEATDEEAIENIIDVAVLLLKNNKEGIKIDAEFVENTLGIEDIAQLFDDFTSWLAEARKTDPN